jgi:hypothetical protein
MLAHSRCLKATLMPECEQPEYRHFDFDPVARAMSLHPEALMTILRVARAHQRAGFAGLEAVKEKPMRGFSDYDQRVRGLLSWLGMIDPIVTQESIRESDPGRTNNVDVLWILGDAFGTDPFRVCDLVRKLSPEAMATLQQITSHKSGDAFNELKVAQFFTRQLLDRWFEGFHLVKTGRTPKGKTEWCVEMKKPHEPKRSCEEPL